MVNKTDQIIETFVDKLTNELRTELDSVNKKLDDKTDAYIKLTKENNELLKEIEAFNLISNRLKNITSEQFETLLSILNLKHNDFKISGMGSDDIPTWFKLLFHYYEDKTTLFHLMDLFNISYPYWAKNYKMPYDYSEQELDTFIKNIDKHYVCNGCILEGNIGFFWNNNVKIVHGDTIGILTKDIHTNIPWQLILSNPLWTHDDNFNKILKSLNHSNAKYFYYIVKYNKLSTDQLTKLLGLIPFYNDRLPDSYSCFISETIDIFKNTEMFDKKFKHKITGYSGSIFKTSNFTTKTQKDFIKNTKLSIEDKISLINRMSITAKEKTEFLCEIANIFFNED